MVDEIIIIEGYLIPHNVQGYEGTFDCAVMDYQHHISIRDNHRLVIPYNPQQINNPEGMIAI